MLILSHSKSYCTHYNGDVHVIFEYIIIEKLCIIFYLNVQQHRLLQLESIICEIQFYTGGLFI